MKKYMIFILMIGVLFLASCTKEEPNEFKVNYESLNGQKNSKGIEYRNVDIKNENPFVFTTAEEVVKMINNKETFFVYFGDKMCPWCRSVIEAATAVSIKYKVPKIYYVPIWDDDHNEILRDVYKLNEKGKPELVSKGKDSYYDLLKLFDDVLSKYTLTNEEGKKVKVGEKRIYAPNFIKIEEGKAIKLIDGISEKQKDANDELTTEILSDEVNAFIPFFTDFVVDDSIATTTTTTSKK